jgi:streptomycin 6-kinase
LPAAIPVPPGLLAFADRGEGWTEWLHDLPRLARDIVDDWDLRVDGAPVHGFCALVLPVRTTSGRPAVLKVSWPHEEAEHEHLVLQALHGNGMVELYRADPRRQAMLLERLHTQDLGSLDEAEACEVVASFYSRIHVPALPQLRTLTSYVDRWTAALAALPRDAPLPRRLVEQAVSLGRSFVSDPASDGMMIHGDLHYGNVLAADREPWLVIDPKPVSGDPHYEVAPLLWNRWEEVLASGNVRGAVRRRFHAVVDAALLDEDRARDWVVVRMLHNAMWTVTESAGTLTEEDHDWLTECVAIAKAVQG